MYPNDVLVQADNVVCRPVAGELLIVPVRGKVGDLASIYSLKGVGTTVWNALAEPQSLNDLCELVANEYNVPLDQARIDLESFLSDLLASGLCRVVPAK